MPFEIVPPGTHIDFLGRRRVAFAVSALLLLGAAAAIPIQGVKLGIDFAGGTEVQVRFREVTTDAEGPIRTIAGACGVSDPIVVRYGEADASEYLIRFGGVSQEALDTALLSGDCPLTDANRAALAAATDAAGNVSPTSGPLP